MTNDFRNITILFFVCPSLNIAAVFCFFLNKIIIDNVRETVAISLGLLAPRTIRVKLQNVFKAIRDVFND